MRDTTEPPELPDASILILRCICLTGRVVLTGSGKELLANERVREAYLGL